MAMRTVSKTVNPGSNPGSPALKRSASTRLIAGLALALLLTLVELIDQVRPWSLGPFSSPGLLTIYGLWIMLGVLLGRMWPRTWSE